MSLTTTERLPNLTDFHHLLTLHGRISSGSGHRLQITISALRAGERTACLTDEPSWWGFDTAERTSVFAIEPGTRVSFEIGIRLGGNGSPQPTCIARIAIRTTNCNLQVMVYHGSGPMHSNNNDDTRLLQRAVSSVDRAGQGLGFTRRRDHRIYSGDGERPTGFGVSVPAWRGN